MMKPKYFIVLLIVPFMAQGAEWPQRIEVYVDGPTPISGIHTARSKGVQVDVLNVAPAESFEQPAQQESAEKSRQSDLRCPQPDQSPDIRAQGRCPACDHGSRIRKAVRDCQVSLGRHRWADDHS